MGAASILDRSFDDLLDDAVAFHGHLCPGQVARPRPTPTPTERDARKQTTVSPRRHLAGGVPLAYPRPTMDATASLRVLYPTTTRAGFLVREAASPAPNQPRLHDRVRAAIRARHYSRQTEKAYVAWIRRFILFHRKRHPAEMGGAKVTQFLSALVVDRNVAASTQSQALSAILFLYRDALEQDLPWLDDIVPSKRAARLPVVLRGR